MVQRTNNEVVKCVREPEEVCTIRSSSREIGSKIGTFGRCVRNGGKKNTELLYSSVVNETMNIYLHDVKLCKSRAKNDHQNYVSVKISPCSDRKGTEFAA